MSISRCPPSARRSNNGAESVSRAAHAWATVGGIRLACIQPGKRQQHAYIERFNRTVRYDWFTQHRFDTVADVQGAGPQWLWTHNNERPDMALDGITPARRLTQAA